MAVAWRWRWGAAQPELWDDDEWDGEWVGEEEDWGGSGAEGEDESDSNAEDHPDNDYPDEPDVSRRGRREGVCVCVGVGVAESRGWRVAGRGRHHQTWGSYGGCGGEGGGQFGV